MHFLILYTLEFNEFSLNKTKANISIVKLELFFLHKKQMSPHHFGVRKYLKCH